MIGYVRVSAKGQNPARQEELMRNLGVEKVYVDILSGENLDRPALHDMFSYLREGDTVVVDSVSRLTRSATDMVKLIDMFEGKGVDLHCQREQINLSSPTGKLMLTHFASLAEHELLVSRQRQREGIEIAKREGKYKGRKRLETDWKSFRREYDRIILGRSQAKYAQKKLGLKPATYFRRVHEYEQRVGIRDKDNKVIESAKAEYERKVREAEIE